MPGYSGTPLPKKLGLKDQFRVGFLDLPDKVGFELEDELKKCKASNGSLDFAMIFVKSQSDLEKHFTRFSKRLVPAGILWVSWPKKSSGMTTDLNENVVRKIGLNAGLVDVKVCAVTDVWSGLKFVIRLKDRARNT